MLAKHPQKLNAVVSISPFMHQSQVNLPTMLKQEIKRNELKHTIYYRYAMGDDYPEDYKKLTTEMKASDFNVKNFNVDGWWFPQADHITTPGLTITRSLYEVFEYWYSCQSEYIVGENKNVGIIDKLKQKIETHYGTSLSFSIGILNGKGYAFYNKGDYANAILAWRQLITLYPNFAQSFLNIAKCQKALNQPTNKAISDLKINLLQSSIFTADQKAEMLKEAESL